MSSEPLSERQMSDVAQGLLWSETNGFCDVAVNYRTLLALFDLARANPLPAVDASLDELEGLIKERKAT